MSGCTSASVRRGRWITNIANGDSLLSCALHCPPVLFFSSLPQVKFGRGSSPPSLSPYLPADLADGPILARKMTQFVPLLIYKLQSQPARGREREGAQLADRFKGLAIPEAIGRSVHVASVFTSEVDAPKTESVRKSIEIFSLGEDSRSSSGRAAGICCQK